MSFRHLGSPSISTPSNLSSSTKPAPRIWRTSATASPARTCVCDPSRCGFFSTSVRTEKRALSLHGSNKRARSSVTARRRMDVHVGNVLSAGQIAASTLSKDTDVGARCSHACSMVERGNSMPLRRPRASVPSMITQGVPDATGRTRRGTQAIVCEDAQSDELGVRSAALVVKCQGLASRVAS